MNQSNKTFSCDVETSFTPCLSCGLCAQTALFVSVKGQGKSSKGEGISCVWQAVLLGSWQRSCLSLLTWILRLWSKNVTLFPFLVSCLAVVSSDTSLKARGTLPCVLRSETCWLPLMCPDLSSTYSFVPPNQFISQLMLLPQITTSWAVRATSKRCCFPNDNCMWTSSCRSSCRTRLLQGQPCVGSDLGTAVAAGWAFWVPPWELPHSLKDCCGASAKSLEMTPDSGSGVADPASLLLHEVLGVLLLKGAVCAEHILWLPEEQSSARLWLLQTLPLCFGRFVPVFVAWVTCKGKASLFCYQSFFLSVVFPTHFHSGTSDLQHVSSFSLLFHIFFSSPSAATLQVSDGGDALLRVLSLLPSWNSSQKSAWSDAIGNNRPWCHGTKLRKNDAMKNRATSEQTGPANWAHFRCLSAWCWTEMHTLGLFHGIQGGW